MAPRARFLLAALLLAAIPPIPGADAARIEVDARMVHEASGATFGPALADEIPQGVVAPLDANRSYRIEIRVGNASDDREARVQIAYNGTQREARTVDGVASFPVGRPPVGDFFVRLDVLPDGAASEEFHTFDWIVLPSDGPRDAESVERWGYASDSTWRTWRATFDATGFARFTVRLGGIVEDAGGWFYHVSVRRPDGTGYGGFSFLAADGAVAARAVLAAERPGGDVDSEVEVAYPDGVGGSTFTATAQGVEPAGTVVTLTQGVLSPDRPDRFSLVIEADPGILLVDETASGRMEAHGSEAFDGGRQVKAEALGVGYSTRENREARIEIPAAGSVFLLGANPNAYTRYQWTYAGVGRDWEVYGGVRFAAFTGLCDGEWSLRATTGGPGRDSFALLFLEGHAFPPHVDAEFDTALGDSACRIHWFSSS